MPQLTHVVEDNSLNKIVFRPSLIITMSGYASVLSIPLSCTMLYFILKPDLEGITVFGYYASWFMIVGLPALNIYCYWAGNWEISLEEDGLVLANNNFVKSIRKAIAYNSISSIEMKGIISKSLKLRYDDKSFTIPSTSLLYKGDLPNLKFKDGAIHGPGRNLIRLKYEIEQRAGLEDNDPFLPYFKPSETSS